MKTLLSLTFISLFLVSGCQTQSEEIKYYEPLNTLQQEFYDIQTLYETGKYEDTIELGKVFIKRYPRDILNVSVKYYVASSYQELGKYDQAKALYQEILKNHPDDDWGRLAKVGIEEMKDL